MPVHHVGKRGAPLSDRSSGSSTSQEAARDEPSFNSPILPTELMQRTVALMHPRTRQDFSLTSRENHDIAADVEKVARKVALEEVRKLAGDIYDTARAKPEPLPDGTLSRAASLFGVAQVAGPLLKDLDEKRQAAFAKDLAGADPQMQARCFGKLKPYFRDFEESNQVPLLKKAIELLGSADHGIKQDAAGTIAVAETQGLLKPEHDTRIKEICDQDGAARFWLKTARNNARLLSERNARELLDDAKAIEGNDAERFRILKNAAIRLEVEVNSAIKNSGQDKERLSAAIVETEKTAADIYDAALPGPLPEVSWWVKHEGLPGYNPRAASASDVAEVMGPLLEHLNNKRQTDLTEKLKAADPEIRSQCLKTLAPHFGDFSGNNRPRPVEETIKLLGSKDFNAIQNAAVTIAKVERQGGVLTLEHESEIRQIYGRNGEARSQLRNARDAESQRLGKPVRDARQLLEDAKAAKNTDKRMSILYEAARRLDPELRSPERRMETYLRNQDKWESSLDKRLPDRGRGEGGRDEGVGL